MWTLVMRLNGFELWRTAAGYLVCDKYNREYFFFRKMDEAVAAFYNFVS